MQPYKYCANFVYERKSVDKINKERNNNETKERNHKQKVRVKKFSIFKENFTSNHWRFPWKIKKKEFCRKSWPTGETTVKCCGEVEDSLN